MILYCLAYNNYYNRQVKKEDALNGYLPFLLSEPIEGVNFNPNDGVNTIQVINWKESQLPNYIVCVDDLGNIHSRWFVLDAPRLRNGQYNLALRRDLFVDYYDPIITAPCFIEKAIVDDSDPAIYNSENMTFNQIKTSETLLKDKTNCPWIIGYFARTTGETTTTLSGNTISEFPVDIALRTSIEDWEYYKLFKNNGFYGASSVQPYIRFVASLYGVNSYPWEIWGDSIAFPDNLQANDPETLCRMRFTSVSETIGVAEQVLSEKWEDILQSINGNYGIVTQEKESEILNLNGRFISATSGGQTKIYKAKVTPIERRTKILVKSNSGDNEVWTTFTNAMTSIPAGQEYPPFYDTFSNGEFSININSQFYELLLEEQEVLETTYSISANRYNLLDAPYDMFAIPYGDNLIIKNTGAENWVDITSSASLAFNTAMSIAQKYQGAGFLYDIQLLPFCPARNIIIENNVIDLNNDNLQFSTIQQGENVLGIILNISQSSFSFDIPLNEPIQITNKKQQALCDMYRLCSPNYNGVFEFNVAKNDGINRFNVDCTYLPFNPYIHINPNFKNLYGSDFDDSRGLIIGGDFSLPVITDKWETYKLNNKNYEQIFNRQIQNMEVNNSIQRQRETFGILTGAGQAGIQGAMTGAIVGGPMGALAGIATGAMSLGAGIADWQLAERARQEALDYTKDQFGYQLGNIKALPDGISKTTAYTKNNKIFPFLEYYTCTDIEKEALANKIKYNGMTVMRIGTIGEFIRPEKSYIKGQLIRIEDFEEDFHILNEIANEVNKGVFV